MSTPDYTRLLHRLRILALVTGVLLSGGCRESPSPAYETAGLRIPEALVSSLAEVERAMFFDILALGSAVAREETDALGEPIVDRLMAESRALALPYSLAAEAEGWTDAQLREAYEAQPELELEVRHMVRLVGVGDGPEVRERARSIAADVAGRALAGEDFALLAATYSEEPGAAERGGLLQPGRLGSWVDPFWQAAASLRVGQVSDVVESPYGYHVIRLEARRPVPFDQASRTDLLTRIVPAGRATQAAEAWATGEGAIEVSPAAAETARQAIVVGEEVPDSLVIARGAGGEFTGAHLIAGWALLEPAARAALEADGGEGYLDWVEGEARVVLWSLAGDARGLDVPARSQAEAELVWLRKLAIWSQSLGLSGSVAGPGLVEVGHRALLSGAPEARGARQELRSLRPRLRAFYPIAADF